MLTLPTEGIDDLKLVRGARHTADSDWWEGGQILDPDNGKTYTLRLRVNDDTLNNYILLQSAATSDRFIALKPGYVRNDCPTEPGAMVFAAVD